MYGIFRVFFLNDDILSSFDEQFRDLEEAQSCALTEYPGYETVLQSWDGRTWQDFPKFTL